MEFNFDDENSNYEHFDESDIPEELAEEMKNASSYDEYLILFDRAIPHTPEWQIKLNWLILQAEKNEERGLADKLIRDLDSNLYLFILGRLN